MLTRSTFKRKPPAAYVKAERIAPVHARLTVPVNLARITDDVLAQPKTEPHRNRALLDLAMGKPCLFMVPGECVGGTSTTVACHSNKSAHGKAGARKADDEYSVWGCFGCHAWLDIGKAPTHTKDMVFMRSHADQVLEWRRIAASAGASARDRLSAQWALDQLNATPI